MQRLAAKEFKDERLNQVKDIFVFNCFTGLPNVDVQQLSQQDFAIGMDGGKCIYAFLQKTDTNINF